MASGPSITIGSAVNNVALTATNSTTFTYSWSTSGVSAGSYTVTVTGTDLAGNTYAGSDKITITLDSAAPTVTLTDTDDDNLLASTDTVTITASFDEAMTATPTISISGVVNNLAMSSGGVSFNKSQVASPTEISNFRPQAVFIADIDGDGHMDVISNNYDTPFFQRIYWYKNNGEKDPAFTENLVPSYGEDIRSLLAADMDGDGDMDIISVHRAGINWYENVNGDGSSWRAANIVSGYGVSVNFSSGYVADMDNDGDNDIVAANSGNGSTGTWDKSGGIGWYENDGEADPSFTRKNIIDYAYGANNVVVADLNGDGNLDIVSTWAGYPNNAGSANSKKAVNRHINDGNANPSFTTLAIRTGMPNLTSVFAADMDGDGHADVVTSQRNNESSLSLFKNNGLGAFAYSNIPTNSEVSDFRSVYPGDINGDGHMDFVVSLNPSSYESFDIQLFENDGNSNPTWTYSTIATSTNFNKKLFVEDIDGDGDADVLSVDNTEPVSWYENGPNYSYTWDVDRGGAPSDGTYAVTVAGADLAGNAYSGTDSITFTLDTTAPTIQSIYSSADGSYNQGDTVTLYLVADEALTVDTSSGTPTISFDSSGTASYTTGSGTSSLTFTYTVGAGENSSDLNATALSLNSGTIRDSIGNNLDLTLTASGTTGALNANNDIVIDTTSPTLVITPPAGLKVTNSSVVTVTLTYNEPITGLTTNVASYGAGTTGVGSLKLISFTSSTTAVVEIYPNAEGTVRLVHSPGAPNVTDIAGNTIASTVSCSFTYDITPPSTPVSPTLSIASDSGPRDYITGIVTPTLKEQPRPVVQSISTTLVI